MIVEEGRRRDGRGWIPIVVVVVMVIAAIAAIQQRERLGGAVARLMERLENEFGRRDYVYKGPPLPERSGNTDIAEAHPPVQVAFDERDLRVGWGRFDNAARMGDYYPRMAAEAAMPGEVIVACRWNDEGRITACTILSETPEGYGFGAATLKMLYEGGRVDSKTPGEAIVAGEGIRMRMRWALE